MKKNYIKTRVVIKYKLIFPLIVIALTWATFGNAEESRLETLKAPSGALSGGVRSSNPSQAESDKIVPKDEQPKPAASIAGGSTNISNTESATTDISEKLYSECYERHIAESCKEWVRVKGSDKYPLQAKPFLETICPTYDLVACYELGKRAVDEGDKQKASEYFEQACKVKYLDSCVRAVQEDEVKLIALQGKCNSKSGASCFEFAEAIESSDAAKALEYLKKACNLKLKTACSKLSEKQKEAKAQIAEDAKQAKENEDEKALPVEAAMDEGEPSQNVSPQDLACLAVSLIKYADKVMKDENAIGSESGFVDMKILHDAGGSKVEAKKCLAKMQSKYGNKVNLGKCRREEPMGTFRFIDCTPSQEQKRELK